MGWEIWDFITNVCRSVSDVLHIGLYLIFFILAILFAAYRSKSKTYNKYIYWPFMYFLVKHKFATLVKARKHGRSIPNIARTHIWASASNRLPYIVKAIKDFFKRRF